MDSGECKIIVPGETFTLTGDRLRFDHPKYFRNISLLIPTFSVPTSPVIREISHLHQDP